MAAKVSVVVQEGGAQLQCDPLIPAIVRPDGTVSETVTVPLVGLYGLSGRFIEYLAPMTVWVLALVSMDASGRLREIAAGVSWPGKALAAAGAITAIAGLHTLEAGGLRNVLMNAVEAATRRSRELGEEFLRKL